MIILIKFILLVGIIITYVAKFRPGVFTRIKAQKFNSLLFVSEIITPLLGFIQLYFLNPSAVLIAYFGLIIFISGIVLEIISRIQLGSNYLPYWAADFPQKIINSGTYRIVRHPIYLGGILEILGFELSLKPILAFVVLIIIPIALKQINKEEKILVASFKSEWQAFSKKTPYKLIPFIY